MPYLTLFSTWEVLVSGIDRRARFTKLTIAGYFVLGLLQYWCFAPVYWGRVYLNLRRQQQQPVVPATDLEADQSSLR